MGKKKEIAIPGQLVLDLSTETTHYVVQGNDLITSRQSLKLNSAKIVRTLIMQIKKDDDEFKTYHISIPELAKLLSVKKNNLYRDINSITKDIESNPVRFLPKNKDKKAFIDISWCDAIGYDEELGLLVKINPLLKPYLLQLQNKYTQYQLDDILRMKSVYAIRLYELLIEKAMGKQEKGTVVEFKLSDLRAYLNCENKFERISQFREKVLDVAIKEIYRCTFYDVSYEFKKEGKSFDTVYFKIISLVYKPV